MKKVISLLITLTTQVLSAQTIWTRSPSNLVMIKTNNLYEGTFIGSPAVIEDNDTLKMLYAGNASSEGRIFFAYSPDGISWVKHNNATPVLDVSAAGNWDSYFLDTPSWLKDSAGYKMYYFGDTDNVSTGGCIGLATSPNGINWTRYGTQPVLSPGNPGDWDGLFVADPTVIFDGNSYFMWYTGVDTTWQVKIGFAISPDGLTWTKYPGNPVLNGGTFLSWEGFGVGIPTVLKRNGQFEMWYDGVSYFDVADNGLVDTIRIGYATSTDGAHWSKLNQNPVFGTYSSGYNITEYRGPWAPSVVYRTTDSKYYMWYETGYGFGLATSPDDVLSIFQKNDSEQNFSVYPNPATSFVIIDIADNNNKQQLQIFNSLGAVVKEFEITGSTKVNIADIPCGLYFIHFLNQSQHTLKFVKL